MNTEKVELKKPDSPEPACFAVMPKRLHWMQVLRGNRHLPGWFWTLYYMLATPVLRINLWRLRFRDWSACSRVNLGSGPDYRSDWWNVEGFLIWKSDACVDIRQGLPFPDGSMNFIYCNNVLEHFTPVEIIKILQHCRKALAPHGIMRIIVPDSSCKLDVFKYNEYMLCNGNHKSLLNSSMLIELARMAGWNCFNERQVNPNFDQPGDIYDVCVIIELSHEEKEPSETSSCG